MISVVVNFFDNRREARNTLFSLTEGYQRASDVDYEVVAIDNGSSAPLDEAEVRAFGPRFSYRYVSTTAKTPAPAINAAVREARGDHVLVVIDGAHILSPGILRHADEAFRLFASPFVATCALHLGPERQNSSVSKGYNQQVEDAILAGSGWRENGYRLYYASRSFADLGQGWFGQMYESGCYGMKKAAYLAMGGLDERFVEPGGGMVNLDFFARAVSDPALDYVVLLGEATFHQVHGGVATNAPLANHPFARFHDEYVRIRGHAFDRPARRPFFLGDIPAEALMASYASAQSGLKGWAAKFPPDVDLFPA